MVLFNHATRELTAKIVYYGPGLCGKTTNLKVLHERLEKGTAGRLLSLATAQDRTIYFDLLPVELGNIKGYTVRFQLCTVPGQVFYNETRKLVLRGVDGIVFVVDSQWSMLSHDLESFQNLKDNLREADVTFEGLPIVIQYNKRDLPGVLGVEALQEALSFQQYPYVEAVAAAGHGVMETFKLVSKLTFVDLLRRLQKTESEAADALLAASGEAGLVKSSTVRKSTFVPPVAPPPPTLASPPDESMWSTIITHDDVFSETVPKKPSRPAGLPPTTTSGSISLPPVKNIQPTAPAAPFETETDVFGLSHPPPEAPPPPLIDLPPLSLELPMIQVQREREGLEAQRVAEPEATSESDEFEARGEPAAPAAEELLPGTEDLVAQAPVEDIPPPPPVADVPQRLSLDLPADATFGAEEQVVALPEAEAPEPFVAPAPPAAPVEDQPPGLSERVDAIAGLMEKALVEVDGHEARLSTLATRLDETEDAVSRAATSAQGSSAMVAVLQAELAKTRSEIDRIGSEADGSVTSIEILRNELEGARNDIDRVTADLAQRVAETQSALRSDEVAQTRLREEMRRLSAEAPSAQAWKTEITVLKTEVDRLQTETGSGERALRAGMLELRAQLDALGARLDRPSNDLVVMRERVDSLRLELDVVKTGLADAKTGLQEVKLGLPDTDAMLADLRGGLSSTTASLAALRVDLDGTRTSLSDVKSGLDASQTSIRETQAGLDEARSATAAVKGELDGARVIMTATAAGLADNKRALGELRGEVGGTKTTLKSLEARIEEATGLRHELSDLAALKAVVAGQAALMEALLEDQLTNLRAELLTELAAVRKSLTDELAAAHETARLRNATLEGSLRDVTRELQSLKESEAADRDTDGAFTTRLNGLESRIVEVGGGADALKAAVDERLASAERRSRSLAESLRRALDDLG